MEIIEQCPLCGKSKLDDFLECADFSISKEKFNIVKCASCGFIFTNPRPEENKIAKYYNSEIYISHHANKKGLIPWAYRIIRNIQFVNKTNLIKGFFKTPVSILDIGCGTGDFLGFCKSLQWQTTGVEPSLEARQLASEKKITVYDLNYLNTTNDTFDAITMWHVLEHVHNLAERLQQLSARLKENGIIVIAVPNHNSKDAKHYGPAWAAYDVPRHLSHFTTTSIQNLFKPYGFKLECVLPMKYDAYYVSIKSEENKNRGFIASLFLGVVNGIKSNLLARNNKEYSSLIYVFKK